MPTRPKRPLRTSLLLVLASLATAPLFTSPVLAAEENGPASIAALPAFRHLGVVLDYKDLKYNPCNDILIPSVIATDQLQKPLGRYYLYYAPHNAPGGVCLAYADSPAGPWKAYEAKRGLDYTPRTAMLAVVVSVILAILGTVMAVYLILLGA